MIQLRVQKIESAFVLGLWVFVATGCKGSADAVPEISLAQVDPGSSTQTSTSTNTDTGTGTSTTVCDPLGDTQVIHSRTNGLRANLFALPDALVAHAPQNVAGYLLPEYKLDATLFFSQINVPTRPFDRGFITQAGEVLKRPSGDTLYEYFALSFTSKLALATGDLAGQYQLAVLSDDGSILSLDQAGSGTYQSHINNDGFTPTRLRCGSSLVSMDSTTLMPLKLEYFQGPRYHISLILIWRRYDAAAWALNGWSMDDPLCNQSGNSLFFNSAAQPPTPQAGWTDLESRGWKVLQPENFVLESNSNPCDCQGVGCGGIGI